MAWSSEAAFSGGKPFKLVLTINPNGQSVSGNWTDVDYSLVAWKTGYSPTWSNNRSSYSVSVGSTASNSQNWQGGFTYDMRNVDHWTIRSSTKRVYHAANGTSPVYAGGNASLSGIGYAAVPDINRTLPTIPRKSTPTFSPTSVNAGSSVTIYTNRASTGFLHTITYKFGSKSGTVGTNVGGLVDWTPPLSLLDQIPNSTSGTCTITCTTYSGSTNLGSVSKNLTIKAPSSVVPSFTDMTITEGNSAVETQIGQYVQNASQVNVTLNGATGAYGSTIKSYKLDIGGAVVNAQSGTGVRIPSSGSVQVKGTVTDSRGRTKTKTQTINVLPYSPPKINSISYQRALADGTPSGDGNYIRVNINATASSLKVGGVEKNTLGYSIFSREHETGSFTMKKSVIPLPNGALSFNSYDVISGPYDVETSYDVQTLIVDQLATSVQQGLVAVGKVFMHWGGKDEGLGVGKYWERGSVDTYGQMYQNNGEKVQSDLDTGWVDLAYAPGFEPGTAGQISYRVKNGVVYIRGGAQGEIDSGVYQIVTSTPIPPEYRPAQHYRTGGMGSSMKGYIGIEINADDGLIRLGWSIGPNGSTSYRPAWLAAGCSYPVEP